MYVFKNKIIQYLVLEQNLRELHCKNNDNVIFLLIKVFNT